MFGIGGVNLELNRVRKDLQKDWTTLLQTKWAIFSIQCTYALGRLQRMHKDSISRYA